MKQHCFITLASIALSIVPQASSHARDRLNVTVKPGTSLTDTPFRVRLRGAKPSAMIVLTARFQDRQAIPQTWTAIGTYQADRRGGLDTQVAASTGGTYRGVVPGGLACTALPVPPDQLNAYMRDGNRPRRPIFGDADSYRVTVSATVDGRTLPPVTIERGLKAPGLTEIEISDGRVRGIYVEPSKGRRGVPIVVVGGSEGGVPLAGAIRMANRGHPALAIAYFGYKDLSPTLRGIDVETLADGAAWLARRTGVARVAMIGTSRGTEAVQLASANFPQHLAAVILSLPSPVIMGSFEPEPRGVASWRVKGQPVPQLEVPAEARALYASDAAKSPPGVNGAVAMLPSWHNPAVTRAAEVPFDRILVPMLVIGASDDAMWPSGYGARNIGDRMTAIGKRRQVELHVYPDAGHSISFTGSANPMTSFGFHRVAKTWLQSGGTVEGNCQASFDAWEATVRFLKRLSPRGT